MKGISNLFVVAAMILLLVAAISRVTMNPVYGVASQSLLILTNTFLLLGITMMLLEGQKKK
ncbi:MAG: hypothetical protein V1674_02470 [Candidatus Omnitrophota bacterium]